MLILSILARLWKSSNTRLPPGPPPLPLIGNLHQTPAQKRWLQFHKWAEEYGPIYTVFVGSKPVVVLTSPETVGDLLDKRSHIYSSRPALYTSMGTSGGLYFADPGTHRFGKPIEHQIQCMQYDNTWKMCRRVFSDHLNTIKAARQYHPYLDLESKQLLNSLLESPTDFQGHIRRCAYSFMSQMVFGFRTPESSDRRGIHMDPTRHPNPHDFDPSRYLHDKTSMKESMLSPDQSKRDHYLFGAGRRMCQGVDSAELSLFLSISRILWAFTISKVTEPHGGENITPSPEALVGGLAQFPARIVPRSEQRARTVREEWELVQEACLRAEDQQWKAPRNGRDKKLLSLINRVVV
ncbi:cytochrome P450 [Apiospora rasikravindrae]|uniref:Cytochrome P450 n=1 Tax=Apiospora rasikravindrae TaxID=990691 RepID=A0ABR1TIT8_9PEZI